jgi:hypothetical protein
VQLKGLGQLKNPMTSSGNGLRVSEKKCRGERKAEQVTNAGTFKIS